MPPEFAVDPIGPNDQRQRIPAHDRRQFPLEFQVARESGLGGNRDRIDEGRRQCRGPAEPGAGRVALQGVQQETGAFRSGRLEDGIERLEPLGSFLGVGICERERPGSGGSGDRYGRGRSSGDYLPSSGFESAEIGHNADFGGIYCVSSMNQQNKMPAALGSLDATDLKILAALQRDGSLSNVELARLVHLSPSPCLARVKALRQSGVIRRYVALVDPEAIGLGVSVFISISLREQSTAALAEFERRIEACDEVMECYLMTGDADYLLRVVVSDIRALERFILDRLSPIPGVEKIRSSFTLKQVRYKTELPLP